jgi:hypothetical protein
MPHKDPETRRAFQKAYRERNRELLAAKQVARQRAEQEADPAAYSEKVRQRAQSWRQAHPEQARADSRARATARYEQVKDSPEYKMANMAKVKAWREKNREAFRSKTRVRRAERYATDMQFKLGLALRRRLYMAVRNNHRSGIAVRELGCSVAELKAHIESKFQPGMNWGNWSPDGWHIDHIKPLAAFDLTDPAQITLACHYTNLQPLWSGENVRKGATCREHLVT